RRSTISQVRKEMEDPHCIRVTRRQWDAFSAKDQSRIIVGDLVGTPAVLALRPIVERWIGQHVVGFQRRVLVIEVGVTRLDVSVQPVDEEVHPTESVREVLTLLAKERELVTVLGEE